MLTEETVDNAILAMIEEHLYDEFSLIREVSSNPRILNYTIGDHKLYVMVEDNKLTLLTGPIGKSVMIYGRSVVGDLNDPSVWDTADEWLLGEMQRIAGEPVA